MINLFLLDASTAAVGSKAAHAAVEATTVGVPATGRFAVIAGIFVGLLVQLMKSSAFAGWMKTVDRRYRIAVPMFLSAVVACAGPWLNIVGWEDAVYAGITAFGTSVGVMGELVFSSAMGIRTGGKDTKPGMTLAPSEPAPVVSEATEEPQEPSA